MLRRNQQDLPISRSAADHWTPTIEDRPLVRALVMDAEGLIASRGASPNFFSTTGTTTKRRRGKQPADSGCDWMTYPPPRM